MIEIRASLLPEPSPLRVLGMPASLADRAVRPLLRGLVFAAALSLPVLGSALADRFHGGTPGAVQAAAVPHLSPRSGTAARVPFFAGQTMAPR